VATPNLGQPREDAHGDIGEGAIFEELQERNPRPTVGFGRSVGEGSERNRMAFEREASGAVLLPPKRFGVVSASSGSCSASMPVEGKKTSTWEGPTTHGDRCPAT